MDVEVEVDMIDLKRRKAVAVKAVAVKAVAVKVVAIKAIAERGRIAYLHYL